MIFREWRAMGGLDVPLKLKGLKGPINRWNKSHFGHIQTKIQHLEREVKALDARGMFWCYIRYSLLKRGL